MKFKKAIISLFIPFYMYSQDTTDNYKYKLGGKFIAEKSGDRALSPDVYQVYCGGIQVIKRIKTSRLGLESGLYYHNKIYENSYFIADTVFPFGKRYVLPISYHNLSLPIGLRYNTKLFYFTAGGYIDYLLSTSVKTGYSKQYKDNLADTRPDRKINIGSTFSIGIEKQINKYFSFFIEARYLFNLTTTKLHTPKNGMPYLTNYGFSIGINHKIN